ncbi:MAG: hypothetical protein JWP61_1925 [Friedmanniella sp.]|nr:hypothetical protein [Friedmanniella sp.]
MSERARVHVPALALGDLVARSVPIPTLVHVRRRAVPDVAGIDVRRVVAEQLAEPLARVRAGDTVAIGVGSRGIARIPEIVTAVVEVLLERGARPFVVPAMGSHGGATAEGQRAVLADLGVTEDVVGVPVRPSMETYSLGDVDGLHVHVSREAFDADHVLVVNRLKSHTSFSGSIESGLAKMVAIGLGKQRGAEELHRLGPLRLESRIVAASARIADRLPLLGGLAVTEGRHKEIAGLDFLGPHDIGGAGEAELLTRARAHESRLPFSELDVLVVDAMGKELSGTGMDTNVLGRRMVRGSPEPESTQVTNVVVLSVTPGSEGNAVGLGLADFAPVSVLDDVDLGATYKNALTAGLQGVQRAQIPIVLATDRDAVAAALLTAGVEDPADARVVRIRSTLALDELLVSRNLVDSLVGFDVVDDAGVHELFHAAGSIRPWPTTTPQEKP